MDLDDEVVYTGEGGRDANTRQQVADQVMTGGNAALKNGHVDGLPVRVFRKTGVGNDYRYDGLYYVEDYWPERRATHGFRIFRYRLVKAASGGTIAPPPPPPAGAPPRVPTTVQRIVRSTAVANRVKSVHGHRCQICGETIQLPDGSRYSQAAHIRPLALPDNGLDVESNDLCLCPNDHIRFDEGALYVEANGDVMDAVSGAVVGQLRTTRFHQPDPAQLAYHRKRWTLLRGHVFAQPEPSSTARGLPMLTRMPSDETPILSDPTDRARVVDALRVRASMYRANAPHGRVGSHGLHAHITALGEAVHLDRLAEALTAR
jgi:putative restriction endonuclease